MGYVIRESEIRPVYGQGAKFSGVFLNLNEADMLSTDNKVPRMSVTI